MKKIFLIKIFLFGLTGVSVSQIKITKATQQKTFGGMGGIFMNYHIDFENKKKSAIEIDSVISIADASSINFSFTRIEPCCKIQLVLNCVLANSPKCKTCPDVTPKQFNLTKGVIVYYRKGNEKHFFKVKKFKVLPDLRAP